THVVRGNEYLSSTPKYTRLYLAFGWEEPVYIHCPLITNEEHQKLSKRSGHSSFEDLIEQGFVSEAVVNFIALLGWSPVSNQEIFSLDELIKEFDYTHISKSPAVFDMTKLRWMNGEYIKAMDNERYYEMALPYIKEALFGEAGNGEDVPAKQVNEALRTQLEKNLTKIADLVKTRIEVFPDIAEKIDFFAALPDYDTEMYTHKKMKTNSEISLSVLEEALPMFEALDDYSIPAIEKVCMDLVAKRECKNGVVLWPLRTAVSGKQMTPGGAYEIMEILGKEESLRRIRKGIEMLREKLNG
ncbi:MAG: glutamate--tRNA ligase, partial [Lachnospiraceae bacterium]|nr:glutamate--tRNA ligase [Lachnospiraceae bacterium]